jgi:hypothetical protein
MMQRRVIHAAIVRQEASSTLIVRRSRTPGARAALLDFILRRPTQHHVILVQLRVHLGYTSQQSVLFHRIQPAVRVAAVEWGGM